VNDDDERFLSSLVDQLAGAVPGLVGISLGGSRATERHAPDSDWDLGLYVRGPFPVEAIRTLVDAAGWPGDVFDEGQWGPVMNGGAWVSVDGLSVDLHWRDLDTIDRLATEAEAGRFTVARIPFHVAPIPSYVPLAELAMGRTVHGSLPRPAFPPALRTAAAGWWRLNARFDLDYATTLGERGEVALCVGLLARVLVQEAYARMAADGRWSTNEKRLIGDTGLTELDSHLGAAGTTPTELAATIASVGSALG
jgi:hypothetical protein